MKSNLIRIAKRVARRIIGRPILGRSILVYHRIARAECDPWNIAITPTEFERQLNKLRSSKAVIPLSEFAKLHIKNKLPRNAVAITFDDGYACNALVAAPMLKSFGFPATFFVLSDAIERHEEFWWDQLEFISNAPQFNYEAAIRSLKHCSVTVADVGIGHGDVSLAPFFSLWGLLRDLSAEERRQYFGRLREQMGLGSEIRATHRPMTVSELRTLASDALFEIGGHTTTHPSLPTKPPKEQEHEVIAGARYLEAMLGKSIRSFAYPFGDWSPVTRDIVKAAGFECAVTAEHRKVSSRDDLFELPRRQALSRNARMLEA